MGRPFVGEFDLYTGDIYIKMFCCLNYIVLDSECLKIKEGHTYFLIFALGNDIQLTLAAIFNVIVSKRCVKFCGS